MPLDYPLDGIQDHPRKRSPESACSLIPRSKCRAFQSEHGLVAIFYSQPQRPREIAPGQRKLPWPLPQTFPVRSAAPPHNASQARALRGELTAAATGELRRPRALSICAHTPPRWRFCRCPSASRAGQWCTATASAGWASLPKGGHDTVANRARAAGP